MNNKPNSAEELNIRLDRVNAWINNCDQKAGILLAFIGAIAAVLLTSDVVASGYESLTKPFYDYWLKGTPSCISYKKTTIFVLLIPILWNSLRMVWYLSLVLSPRTIIEDFKEEGSTITRNSRLHFQTIANKTYNDFKKECSSQSEESYLNDLCSQIYCNSKICNDKFENYKKGVHYFLIVLLFSFVESVVVFLVPQI